MKRREFLRLTALSSGAVVLPGYSTRLLAKAAGARKIRGRVTAQGKPLAEVLLSDGYNIVKTDRRGHYSLRPNKLAEHIFIILPAGYAFPHGSGIPRFYKKAGIAKDYDFELKPLAQNDDRHHFIIWADPQVKTDSNVAELYAQSVPDVLRLKQELGEQALVHGISVGDLVFDQHHLFPAYNAALQKMDIPFFQALGNHDMDYDKGGDESSDATFKGHYGPTYYSFNRGKAHYVVLDDVRYLGAGKKYEGHISQQQLNWLKEDLKYVAEDQLLIINLHIPVHSSVKNKSELYALLEPFRNTHIMSGHTHYNLNNITGHIFEHNHGTVCGGWWLGPYCGDGTPRGYGVYRVEGNALSWYYKSAGMDKTEQMRLYVDALTNQHRILANVWNWDPAWKVEYWADGRYGGLLTQQKGMDPVCVQRNQADAATKAKTSPAARSTDHLFLAHVTGEVGSVKVVATDRFGNRFEKSWSKSNG